MRTHLLCHFGSESVFQFSVVLKDNVVITAYLDIIK